jgi:hypothetical protein
MIFYFLKNSTRNFIAIIMFEICKEVAKLKSAKVGEKASPEAPATESVSMEDCIIEKYVEAPPKTSQNRQALKRP